MKRRKAYAAMLVGALTLSTAGVAVGAPTDPVEEAPLYMWDGTGYTDQPVPYSPHGDPNQVMVPVSYQDVKEDFRSSWVATIFNLHFPKTNSEEEFIAEYQDVLDNFASYDMNAMLFQVRPEQDAWYPSEMGNPWSKYLTGTGVEGTDPGFDPLAIMVDMTHQAGMEYHAWFNPYRVTNTKISLLSAADIARIEEAGYTLQDVLNADVAEQMRIYVAAGLLAENNFAAQHPEWVLRHDEKLFLNPGIPEVQQHIIDTIAEVIQNYDVDAIHFDDYFYPDGFGAANLDPATAADGETFAQYGEGFPDTTQGLEDWRRDNTTSLVRGIHELISAHNDLAQTSVQWGISPAGIWNHQVNDPRGSLTPVGSMSSYLRLYCDTYLWVEQGLLDYVMPQVYWAFATGAAPYGELARWWNTIAEGTNVQVYIGHAMYKLSSSSADVAWTNPNEIPTQLRFNQTLSQVRGSGFYSYGDMLPAVNDAARTQTQETIRQYWDYTALVPGKEWLSHGVHEPTDVRLEGDTLSWTNADTSTSRFFIVYRGEGTAEEIVQNPRTIVSRIWAGGGEDFSRNINDLGVSTTEDNMQFVVTTTNAAGIESAPVLATSPAVEHEVTFDPQNGSEPTMVTVVAGEPVAEPELPTREGYDFVAWSTEPDTSVPYDFSLPVTESLTLYGSWTPVASASLTLTKSADVKTVLSAGETITYSFVVKNTGNVDVTDVTVIEEEFSGVSDMGEVQCPAEAELLEPEASVTCTAEYKVAAGDLTGRALINSAKATAESEIGPLQSPSASAQVATVKPAPDEGENGDTDKNGDTGKNGDAGKDKGGKGHLPKTGANVAGLIGGALAMLIAGGGTWWISRRRVTK